MSLSFHSCPRLRLSPHSKHRDNGFKESCFMDSSLMSETLVAEPENGNLLMELLCRAAEPSTKAVPERLLSGPRSVFPECVSSSLGFTLTTMIEPKVRNLCLALFVLISPKICRKLCCSTHLMDNIEI